MKFLDTEINPLGMGCWPIGGAMFSGEQSLGYANADDANSLNTIHAALDHGITLFDTAMAYGAGHSERLLGSALKDRPDALIVTKIGIEIDEETKQITFGTFSASDVASSIDGCLQRLQRDRIDLVLLHINEMPVADAEPVFGAMEEARQAGKIRSCGWSTDFSASASQMADLAGFQAVEHAMNVFFDAPRMQKVVADNGLTALIRSPLAMGLLSGKYDTTTVLPAHDIRASKADWMEYYRDGRANPDFMLTLDAVRDLLICDGRTLVQGALGWLWAKGEENVPIPGARTVEQIEGIAGALAFGALPQDVMAEIETLIERDHSEPDRPR